jgi:hypothetical protein
MGPVQKNQSTSVELYARELGVAIAQTAFATGDSHEHAALKALLSTLVLDSVDLGS